MFSSCFTLILVCIYLNKGIRMLSFPGNVHWMAKISWHDWRITNITMTKHETSPSSDPLQRITAFIDGIKTCNSYFCVKMIGIILPFLVFPWLHLSIFMSVVFKCCSSCLRSTQTSLPYTSSNCSLFSSSNHGLVQFAFQFRWYLLNMFTSG